MLSAVPVVSTTPGPVVVDSGTTLVARVTGSVGVTVSEEEVVVVTEPVTVKGACMVVPAVVEASATVVNASVVVPSMTGTGEVTVEVSSEESVTASAVDAMTSVDVDGTPSTVVATDVVGGTVVTGTTPSVSSAVWLESMVVIEASLVTGTLVVVTEDSAEPCNRDVSSVVTLSVVTSIGTAGDCSFTVVDWSMLATEVAGGSVTVVVEGGGRVGCCVVGRLVVVEMTTTGGGDDGGNDCCGGLVTFGCGAPFSVDEPAYKPGLLGST